MGSCDELLIDPFILLPADYVGIKLNQWQLSAAEYK